MSAFRQLLLAGGHLFLEPHEILAASLRRNWEKPTKTQRDSEKFRVKQRDSEGFRHPDLDSFTSLREEQKVEEPGAGCAGPPTP